MGASSSKFVQKGRDPFGLPPGPAPTSIDVVGTAASAGATTNLVSSNLESKPSSDGGVEDTRGGGCPMKRSDGSYSFSFSALGRGFQHPNVSVVGNEVAASHSGVSSNAEESGARPREEPTEEGKCAVRTKHRAPEYNVYSQPIDSSNQMPGTPNQLPSPEQSKPLSTERVVSNIPKVGLACCETR
jgi:hypothetical protein